MSPSSCRPHGGGRLSSGWVKNTFTRSAAAIRLTVSASPAISRSAVSVCRPHRLYQAAAYGIPHRDCVITVAGDAVANPQNVRVPFGTLVEDILAFCGLAKNPAYVLLGDVMTGVTVSDTKLPIIPGNTCLLAMTSRKTVPFHPCIGCGRCAQVCHDGLLPYEIIRRLENMHYERLTSLHPEECDGCGALLRCLPGRTRGCPAGTRSRGGPQHHPARLEG